MICAPSIWPLILFVFNGNRFSSSFLYESDQNKIFIDKDDHLNL